jgi:hypothetical protein
MRSQEETMHASYADDMTMRIARDRYFEVNGFGADGGYNDAWVDFKIGPVPLPFPNTAGRVAAVKFHDLHHVLTGYETNATGEFEISAWEIGAGCGSFVTAWAINSGGMIAGLLSSPRRTFAAFVRGRRSRTLYAEPFLPLLDQRVGELRARHVGSADSGVTLRDLLSFVLMTVFGAAVGLLLLALVLPLVPVGLFNAWLRRRGERRGAAA